MICRLLQTQSPACIECGSPIVSLATDAKLLKYRDLAVAAGSNNRRAKWRQVAGIAGFLGGYTGLFVGAALWPPAIAIILGGGAATAGVVGWRNRGAMADVPLLPVATPKDAVEQTGIARKLTDSFDGVLVEQSVIRRHGGVIMRRTKAVPFLVETEPKLVVAGIVRVTSKATEQKLDKAALRSLGVSLSVSGKLEVATIREGDRVRVTGAVTTEMLPELAFHRDAGEVNVMRGAANAVVAVACEDKEA